MKMTLLGHLKELKKRIVWSLLFFTAALVAGLYLAPFIQDILIWPLTSVWNAPDLIYTGMSDSLSIQFSLAGLFALLASAPFWLWQSWLFAAPGLKKNEKRVVVPMIIQSPVLFAAGAAFAYFVLLPIMFGFFIDLGGGNVRLMPNVKDYLELSSSIMKAFGFAFQFPLGLVLLNRAGVVSRRAVWKAARYIIVGIFVIAAALTPPDIISQIALAMPLIFLFGIAMLFMKE
ncbi:MAG: twin-arginine translocase subunit TatC [Rickettsiales bacterium]|jgi:sec-independent protein translocase protein TatC|nr:twin-arginine translocase subunit TatC [Rickettsiales bacterium]